MFAHNKHVTYQYDIKFMYSCFKMAFHLPHNWNLLWNDLKVMTSTKNTCYLWGGTDNMRQITKFEPIQTLN